MAEPGYSTKPPRSFGRLLENSGPFSFLRLDRGKARPAEAFARYSTFAMLFVWAFPMATLVSWGSDDDVRYWLGSPWPISVFLLPVFWGVLYWLQARREHPHKWILIIAALGPCIVFDAVGGDYMNKANLYANQLISTDCTAFFEDKFRLQNAYKAARGFYSQCVAEGAENWAPFSTIEDCPGYQTKMKEGEYEGAWSYLKKAEGRHACVGFCEPDSESVGMWYTAVTAHDACDQAIGQKMMFIRHQSICVLSYSVMISILFIIWGVLAFPTLRQMIQLQ